MSINDLKSLGPVSQKYRKARSIELRLTSFKNRLDRPFVIINLVGKISFSVFYLRSLLLSAHVAASLSGVHRE